LKLTILQYNSASSPDHATYLQPGTVCRWWLFWISFEETLLRSRLHDAPATNDPSIIMHNITKATRWAMITTLRRYTSACSSEKPAGI